MGESESERKREMERESKSKSTRDRENSWVLQSVVSYISGGKWDGPKGARTRQEMAREGAGADLWSVSTAIPTWNNKETISVSTREHWMLTLQLTPQ